MLDCASMTCLDCYFFLVYFYFILVGSRVDVSNEIEWTIWRTNTCPLMNKSRRRTLDIYFIWLLKNKASNPPSEPMVSKYFKTYYFATYGSTVFYRYVELSYLMLVLFLSPKYPDPLLLA
jgi:hypothetical protein